jgi:hypothetical protein
VSRQPDPLLFDVPPSTGARAAEQSPHYSTPPTFNAPFSTTPNTHSDRSWTSTVYNALFESIPITCPKSVEHASPNYLPSTTDPPVALASLPPMVCFNTPPAMPATSVAILPRATCSEVGPFPLQLGSFGTYYDFPSPLSPESSLSTGFYQFHMFSPHPQSFISISSNGIQYSDLGLPFADCCDLVCERRQNQKPQPLAIDTARNVLSNSHSDMNVHLNHDAFGATISSNILEGLSNDFHMYSTFDYNSSLHSPVC